MNTAIQLVQETHTSATSITKPAFDESLRDDFTTSAKTSIFRSGASAPVKVLLDKGLFSEGSSLNFGKGKYDHDTDAIAAATTHCVSYDYTYKPDTDLLGSSYDNLYSGYVVNTLPIKARNFVWKQMAFCARKGVAFIAARTDDIKGSAFEDGVITSIGTFQKSYGKNGLAEEAKNFFSHVLEIKGKAGFSIVACSHSQLSDKILAHAKKT